MAQPLLGFRKKTLSRSQMVIRAILKTIDDTDETLDSTIEIFELTFEEEAKLSMSKMATIVQNFGLVSKKKSRGKTKK